MMKNVLMQSAILSLCLAPTCGAAQIDNSALLPPVAPDAQVTLEDFSPDWVKTLIMTQFRIETATEEGTFASAVRVLDHYAEMGVNGVWINPVYERPPSERYNGYGNFGPHTLSPRLTGTGDIKEGYRVIRDFVRAAHARNIRVIFDIVAWGVHLDAPLFKERPEWFIRLESGEFRQAWGGYLFEWENEEFRQWYFDQAARFIEETGADGFRVDLAPERAGYHFRELRELLLRRGHKIMLMAELPSERRGTYDLDQLGVNGWTEPPNHGNKEIFAEQKKRFGSLHDSTFFFRKNMVDAIRTGTGIGRPQLQQQGEGGLFRFYTVSPLFHDGGRPFVQGSRVRFGYLLFSPFIPVWWIGEEWNNPNDRGGLGGVMFFNIVNWSAMDVPENRAFFEDVKRMIRVRRQLPELFAHFPPSLRDANIAKVDSTRDGMPNPLQAYMRYAENKAVLVVPNHAAEPSASAFTVEIPWAEGGIEREGLFQVTDMMTGEVLLRKPAVELNSFEVRLPAEHLGVYLIERDGSRL